jgi:hypothetical protein
MLALTLSGCGGTGGGETAPWTTVAGGTSGTTPGTGSGSTPAPNPVAISGSAVKGPLRPGATVRAYSLAQGVRGSLLGLGAVGQLGTYTIPVTDTTYAGSVLLEATGAFTDEATGATQDTGATPLRGAALRLAAGAGRSHAQITPLTELAVALAQGRGGLADPILEQAFLDVGLKFSVSHPESTVPMALDASPTTTSQESLIYGLVLAALSQEASAKGVTVMALLAAARADALDGQLDGLAGGASIPLTNASGQTVFWSSDSLTSELALAADTFLRGPRNLSGVTPTDPRVAPLLSYLARPSRPPLAVISVYPMTALTASPIQLDAQGSTDPEGGPLTYRWTVTLGRMPLTVAAPTSSRALFYSNQPGDCVVSLTVIDSTGYSATTSRVVSITARPAEPGPAALSLGSPVTAATVVAGQSFTVTVPVLNSGQTDALSVRTVLAIADTRFTVTPRASNPTTVAAGQQVNCLFDVATTTLAPVGPVSADLSTSGADALLATVVAARRSLVLPLQVVLPPPGPALSIASLGVPASMAADETATFTVDVLNPGGAEAALVTDARLTFDGSDVVWSLRSDSPREVPLGQTRRLLFTVRLSHDAVGGLRPFKVEVFAVGASSGLPVLPTPAVFGALTVLGRAQLRVTSLTLSSLTVSAGTPVDVTATFVAEGSSPITLTQVGIDAGGVFFPPTPAVSLPRLLLPGVTTLTFSSRIDTTRIPADQPVTVSVMAAAIDSVTGLAASVRPPSPPPVLLAQSPAALVITSFTPTPRAVSLGQTLRVELVVTNTGSADCLAPVATLRALRGATDITSQFTIAPAGLLPSLVPGHSQATFAYDVTAPAAGSLGAVSLTATVTGRDANSSAVLSAGPASLAWTLETGSQLALGTLVLSPARISQGQALTAAFTITNSGQSRAVLTGVGLAFTPATGLSVFPRANSTSVAGGETVTLTFDIRSTSTTPAGTRVADLAVQATDFNSGALRSLTVADAARLTVQVPARVVFRSITGDRPANRGQSGNPVTMVLENLGDASASIEALSLRFEATGITTATVPAIPFILPGRPQGQASHVDLAYTVDVSATAVPADVPIRGVVRFADVNTLLSSIVESPLTTPASFRLIVQERSDLASDEFLIVAPKGLDRAGAAAIVSVNVSNPPTRAASLLLDWATPPLSFLLGATDVSSQYEVTPLFTLGSARAAGGTTTSFAFSVKALATATRFAEVTVRTSASARDANDLHASGPVSATASWYVREAADSVLGQPDFTSNSQNRGGGPTGNSMRGPVAAATNGTLLAVSDSLNNRVLLFASLSDSTASGVAGQTSLSNASAGVTSETLRGPRGLALAGPRLLVADWGNNRVLVYPDVNRLRQGLLGASVVLGQATFSTGLANRTTDTTAPASDVTLSGPSDVAVVGTDVVVADTDNHRVLIYRNLGALASGAAAAVVVGQAGFSGRYENRGGGVGPSTMSYPSSVAVTDNRLSVADTGNNRVLIFNDFAGLTNGRAADLVLGQSSGFVSGENRGLGSASRGGLSRPSGVRASGLRLYVSDSGNHRVVAYAPFDRIAVATNGALPDEVYGQALFTDSVVNDNVTHPTVPGTPDAFSLSSPGIAGPLGNTLLYLADENNNRVLRLPIP